VAVWRFSGSNAIKYSLSTVLQRPFPGCSCCHFRHLTAGSSPGGGGSLALAEVPRNVQELWSYMQQGMRRVEVRAPWPHTAALALACAYISSTGSISRAMQRCARVRCRPPVA